MRYCTNCNRITTGEPLYCHFCGRTFDLKICPRGHTNPRIAQVCAECGSRDLSTPAPRLGFGTKLVLWAFTIVPGIVLVFLFFALIVGFINALITANSQVLGQMLVLTLVVGILWLIWIQFPPFIRQLFRNLWRTKKRRRQNRH